MKGSELKKLLREHGACCYKHRAGHDLWIRGDKVAFVPRHDRQEVPPETLRNILACLEIEIKSK